MPQIAVANPWDSGAYASMDKQAGYSEQSICWRSGGHGGLCQFAQHLDHPFRVAEGLKSRRQLDLKRQSAE